MIRPFITCSALICHTYAEACYFVSNLLVLCSLLVLLNTDIVLWSLNEVPWCLLFSLTE